MPLLRVPQNHGSPYDATSLITHFAGATLTPCICAYVVSPIDATVIGITSWSQNLTGVPGFSGVTFKSTTGMTGSNIEARPGKATNSEVDVFLVAAGITEADALAGKWARAPVTVFLTNYEALDMGQLVIQKGFLGQFVQRGQLLTTEIMGFLQALEQQYGKVTRAECDHEFCDAGCTLDIEDFTVTGELTAVTSQTVFRDSSRTEANDAFGNGKITFTLGNNAGYSFHVDAYDNSTKQFTLRTPTPFMPVIGDEYEAVIGCRKRHIEDCVTRFDNVLNFNGFPFVPTLEDLTRLPSQ